MVELLTDIYVNKLDITEELNYIIPPTIGQLALHSLSTKLYLYLWLNFLNP